MVVILRLSNTRQVDRIVSKVIELLGSTDIIAVFTLYTTSISPIKTAILNSSKLPMTFESTVEINPIGNSEILLKSLHSRGTKTYKVIYDCDVFRYMTPERFINTHYKWLQKEVRKRYDCEPDIHSFFTEEDMFQEVYFYLDRILSKFISPDYHNCNLRTYVANRLRWYTSVIVKEQLRLRLADLKAQRARIL